jgi:hypothetical protein
MKKFFTLFLASALLAPALASSIINPEPAPIKASDIMIPIAKNKFVSFEDLAYMKVGEYEKFTGKKMSFFKKIHFKIAQKKLRSTINADGTIRNKKMERMFTTSMDGTTGFHLGGAALGFFLFVIGVLIAYLIDDEKKANRVKWAWIGAAVALLFGIFFIF